MPINYLGLDVGSKRIGVAAGDSQIRIAFPVTTLTADGSEIDQIKKICDERAVDTVVVGYPRNQSGEATNQTQAVEQFVDRLRQAGINCEFQDESVTSIVAEDSLKATNRPYQKEDIDATAASLILTDFIESNHHAR